MVALAVSLPARLENDASIGAGVLSLWGTDSKRRSLPVSGDAKRLVPTSRRLVHGAADPRGVGAAAAVQNHARQLLGGEPDGPCALVANQRRKRGERRVSCEGARIAALRTINNRTQERKPARQLLGTDV
jgi:hypothetical protein